MQAPPDFEISELASIWARALSGHEPQTAETLERVTDRMTNLNAESVDGIMCKVITAYAVACRSLEPGHPVRLQLASAIEDFNHLVGAGE